MRGLVSVSPAGPPGKTKCGRLRSCWASSASCRRRRSRRRVSPSTTVPSAASSPASTPGSTPASLPRSSLARARVYFRVADAPPDWYYVEMASNSPCHAGILPRPKKELVGRRIQYYVDAFDRSFIESRTPEAEALVVASASECRLEAAGGAVPEQRDRRRLSEPARRLRRRGRRRWPRGRGHRRARGGRRRGRGGRGGVVAGGSETDRPRHPRRPSRPRGGAHHDRTDDDDHHDHAHWPPSARPSRSSTVSTLVPGDTIVGTEPLVPPLRHVRIVGPYPMRYAVEVDGVIETNGCQSVVYLHDRFPQLGSPGIGRSSLGRRGPMACE